MISISAGDIAGLIGAEVQGDADRVFTGAEAIDRADDSQLTFVREPKFAKAFAESGAGGAIVNPEVAEKLADETRTLLVVENVDGAIAQLLALIEQQIGSPAEPGIHPTAIVDPSATVHATASVGAYCVIRERCEIGEGTVVHAHAVFYPRTRVGRDCIVHANVTLGSDGFGYVPTPDGPKKIPHVGGVVIGDRVEIGAGSTIDRGKFGDTTIGDDTKIDNLCQIAHNCRIGRACILCAQVGLSGSVTVGDGAILAGQVGAGDNLTIGAGVQAAAQSGIASDVAPGTVVGGTPAWEIKTTMRALLALKKMGKPAKRERAET